MTQVIERHLLRDFEEVIPDDHELDDDRLKSLVRLDARTEKRKEEINQRLSIIEDSLKALDELD